MPTFPSKTLSRSLIASKSPCVPGLSLEQSQKLLASVLGKPAARHAFQASSRFRKRGDPANIVLVAEKDHINVREVI